MLQSIFHSPQKSKLQFLFRVCLLSTMVTSCNNQQSRQQHLDDLTTYVRNHRDSVDFYADQTWDKLDSGFEVRKEKLDKDVSQMDTGMQNSYSQAQADWMSFQNDYNRKQIEKGKLAMMDTLRNSLTLSGVRPDFTNVSIDNILEQYEHFVSVVKANKDAYTGEQWTVINVSWKSLNGRKREIEKDMHQGDEGKIVKLQVEYAAIKASNRPLAPNS